MKIKPILKKVFGERTLSTAKGEALHYICSVDRKINRTTTYQYDKRHLVLCKTLTWKKYHVFRGYYDIDYFNSKKSRFLCHRLLLNAESGNNKCEVGYYDLRTDRFVKIDETYAWCWQQGARLRWHPMDDSKIIYNVLNSNGDGYAARISDAATGKYIGEIPYALYDIAPDFSYGISLNFDRLQRLRPGYGYSCLTDRTERESHPEDDGVFRVDLQSGERTLLYSLQRLADLNRTELSLGGLPEVEELFDEKIHYINHISISPDAEHFIFFHIMTKNDPKNWETCLYVSDSEGKELRMLENRDRVSHYTWIDSSRIMVTLRKTDGTEYYAQYDIYDGRKQTIDIRGLDRDGHPSALEPGQDYITDTYPQKGGFQYLRFFRLSGSNSRRVARFYHDYRLRGEKRCDLHPSVENTGTFFSIDTTCIGGRRSVMIFSRKKSE